MTDIELYDENETENNLVGGEAIAAGGFGCVFRPALKCQGASNRTLGVSKLLIKRYADSEYNEIRQILPIIERIPNNEDYFIAKGITMCSPDRLEPNDLKGFDRKCGNLTKRSITSKNINSKLGDLGVLNTIDGGVDVQKYISDGGFNLDKFSVLNENLLRLLKFGIIPMNGMGMYHMDVKGANILVGSDNKCRLIDWGLTQIQKGYGVPRDMINKPVHFNLPFGVVMFSDDMLRIIDDARKIYNNKGLVGTSTFQQVIYTSFKRPILAFLENNGHYRYIRDSVYPIFTRAGGWGPKIPGPNFEDLIISHIVKIAEKYTHNGRNFLNSQEYFNDVFKHNADVWGFLMSYIDLYSNEPSDFKDPLMKPTRDTFYGYLNLIFLNNIFSTKYSTTRYDINEIIESLKELNSLIGDSIGRLTPKTPSPVAILPPTPPVARVPTPPPVVVVPAPAPMAVPVAATLCDSKKQALCRAKGKVCNPVTGRCVIDKSRKAKAKIPTPKPVSAVPGPAPLCDSAKMALCSAKGKVCNPITGRCVIKKPVKATKTKKVTTKASSHTGLTAMMAAMRRRSSSGISLGTRKRCPRGYRLDSKTKRCKKIK